jgi:hypothetical protein
MLKTINKDNVNLLVDLVYNGTMNHFEEFYGDSVSYQELEQESYIELKSTLISEVGKIKFRKAREIMPPNGLTCKLEMSNPQYRKFIDIYESKKQESKDNPFFFSYGFKISNVRIDPDPNGTGRNQ